MEITKFTAQKRNNMDYKNNRTGFVQMSLPLLAAIIAGVLVIGYLGFIQYQTRREQNDKTQEKLWQQRQALEEAQKAIDTLKQDSETDKGKQEILVRQTLSKDQSGKLQVSTTFIAERTTMLHCLQITGTEGEIRALYNVPVYEPAIEGSSVIISAKGEILTNAHVVGDSPLCLVQTAKAPNYSVPSPSYFARVLAVDKDLDIAKLLIISDIEGNLVGQDFKYFNFTKQTPSVGQGIYIAGFSIASNKHLAITEGIISGYNDISGYIQGTFLITSAKIDSGNSGGAALTEEGELIGLPTFLRGNYETLGYILDLNRAKTYFRF